MCVDCVLASPRIAQIDPGDEPLPEVVLSQASDEQYKGMPDDEIALLARKFRDLHKFCKEKRSPRGCFEYGDTTHFIADCPKRKKLNFSSNKYDYTKWNNYSKGNDKKKYRFGDKKKKKKF
jgi:hypothetical protein